MKPISKKMLPNQLFSSPVRTLLIFFVTLFVSLSANAAVTVEFEQGSANIHPNDPVELKVINPPFHESNIYTWYKIVNGTPVEEKRGSGVVFSTFTPVISTPGLFTFQVNVLDQNGIDEDSGQILIDSAYTDPTVDITEASVNGTTFPVSQLEAFSGDLIKITSLGSDEDGGSVSYAWTANSGAPGNEFLAPSGGSCANPVAFSGVQTTSPVFEFCAPDQSTNEQFQLVVTVTDDESGSDQGTGTKSILVTVKPKTKPVAVAKVKKGAVIITDPIKVDTDVTTNFILDGDDSFDPDGDGAESFLWTPVTAGSPVPTPNNGVTATITVPAGLSAATLYSYDLVYTDDEGVASDPTRVELVVTPFGAPVVQQDKSVIFDDETVTFQVENEFNVNLAWEWKNAFDVFLPATQVINGSVAITNSGRTVVFTPTGMNVANPDRSFTFRLTSTDGNGADSQVEFNITVKDRLKTATFDLSADKTVIFDEETVALNIQNENYPDSLGIKPFWEIVPPSRGSLAVAADGRSAVYTPPVLGPANVDETVTIKVSASEGDGSSLSLAPKQISITVKDRLKTATFDLSADRTVISDEETASLEVQNENYPSGLGIQPVWEIIAPVRGSLAVAGDGLSAVFTPPVLGPLDTDEIVTIKVTASEGNGSALSLAPKQISITVQDRPPSPLAEFEVYLPSADANGNYLEDRVLRLEANADETSSIDKGSRSQHPICLYTVPSDPNSAALPKKGITAYEWETVSGANITKVTPFGDDDGSQFWFKARVPSPNSVVTVKLTVTDCQGQKSSVERDLTIIDDGNNSAPVADAGNDLRVNPGEAFILNGSFSSDPDGLADIESYEWTQTSGLDVSIVDSDKAKASAAAPNTETTLKFTLIVKDKSEGSASSDEVIVNVSSINVPPVAVASSEPSSSPTPVASGATVSLIGDQSTDPEGGSLTFKWVGPTGVTINDFSSAITTFTAPSDGSRGLEFTLEVTDDQGASSTAKTIVNVGAAGVVPTVNAGGDKTVDEGVSVNLVGTADDPDGENSAISYAWRQAGGVPVVLANPASATTSFVAPAVVQNKTVTLELVATDQAGFKAVDEVVINVQENGITGFDSEFITREAIVEDNIIGGSRRIGFKVTDGDLVFLRAVPIEDFETTDGKPSQLPYGLWEYRILGVNPKLDIQFGSGADNGTKWYNFKDNVWSEFEDEDGNSAQFDSNRDTISLQLRDGGPTDQGGVNTDGFVTGTSGLGVPGATTQTTGGRSQLGGGGSMGLPLLLVGLVAGRRRYRNRLSK